MQSIPSESQNIINFLNINNISEIFNLFPLGIFLYKYEQPDKLYLLFGNKTAEKKLKINIQELIGKEFSEIWTEAEKYNLKTKFLSVFHTNDSFVLDQVEYYDKNVIGLFKIFLLKIGTDKLCVIFDNLYNQKISNENLERLEEKFKLLIENSFDAIYLMEGRHYAYVNPEFINITGYTLEELTDPNFDFSQLLTEKSKSIVEQRYQARLRGEQIPNRYITQIRSKNGEIKDIELTTVSLSEAGKVVVMGIMRDITDRIKNEIELKEAKETFLGIINSLNEAVYILDKDYQFLYVNKAAEKMYGFKFEDFIGKTPKFVSAENKNDLNQVEFLMDKAFNGEPQLFEFWGRRADGSIFPKSVSLTQGYFFGEKVIIATARDITLNKIVEEELIKAKEKAEESDRLKSAFLSNMSHEIRTPMNGIMGFASLLAEPNLSEQERFEYVTLLNKSCQRLLKVVNDIMNISQIDSGQMQINKHIFSLGKLIRDLYEANFLAFQEKGLEFRYKIDEKLDNFLINSDEQKLFQVLNNLINNALKFTNKGIVEYGCIYVDGKLKFYVEDTGIGISDEYKEKIFDRFSQENPSITRNYEGAGLGLAICKGIVELLGGEINFISEKNKGSKFFISIPCEAIAEDALLDDKIVSAKDNSKKVILIAEDDIMNYILIERLILRNFNDVEIIAAKNGEEVLEIVKKRKDISLIFMDLKMPRIDGLEATRILRNNGFKMPIIALTAYALSGDKEKALEAGCNDYISKPINNALFFRTLKQYI